MKSNSNNYPKVISQSAGKTQIAYDIIEVEREDIDKRVRKSFDYTYVNVEGELTVGKIVNAIIMDTYSKDAEIALINNELANPGTKEYAEYQSLRTKSKEIAGSIKLLVSAQS